MKKNGFLIFTMLCAVFCTPLSGCKKDLLDPRNPVTLTFWHYYTQQLKTSIDILIDEFNSTVGAQRGIIIQTEYVADAPQLNERLVFAASGEPGAPGLPDIAVIYPRVAITMAERDLLVDFAEMFSQKELSEYVPYFLDEGRLKNNNSIYLIPVAKSTEVLYVNNTIFERFSKDTGVTLVQLSSIEGILSAAYQYHKWSGGKPFIHHVDLFNYAMIGYQQLGEEFIVNNKINLASAAFKKIWDRYFTPAAEGAMAIYNGYGDYLMRTGDIVCVTGTSASITYYPNTVTYPDNTKEPCDLVILPYPVFEGGRQVTMQRGAGMCVFKSNNQKEKAASVFLKWLTEPEQDLRFTSDTGYMPVKIESFRQYSAENATNENVKKMIGAIKEMQREYIFYFPPVFDGFETMQRSFAQALRIAAENARNDESGNITDSVRERFVTENR